MNKKLLSTLMAFVMAGSIALAGCSSSQPTETKSEDKSTETKTEQVASVAKERVYVTPQWLKSAMDGNQSGYEKVFVAEVVYGKDALAKTYDKGHIKDAGYVFDVDVEDADGTEERPYNILPANEVEANLLERGIDKDTKVVLYGEDISGTARVALACLWAGVEDVKVLNGGLDAWKTAGYDVETTKANITAKTSFGTTVPAHPEYIDSMAQAKDKVDNDSNFKLVSIRSQDEWLGVNSGYNYIDRAGEPEGAVWGKGAKTASDVADFTNEDGTVKELDEILKDVWNDIDFTTSNHLSFYCGTGWRACVPFLVMYQEGYKNSISIYDGGWYEWQMHGENKVQVGDPKSETCQHVTVADLPTDKATED